MKYCPTCETRYDEEILRFCMKDGTPLVEEAEPAFTTMPSESFEPEAGEPEEVTVIRRNSVPPPPIEDDSDFRTQTSAQRIVVPTRDEPRPSSPRVAAAPPYQQPGKPNAFKIVVLTILGTLAVVAVAGLGIWLLQRGGRGAANANQNANLNQNVDLETNFNFNSLPAFNANTNVNTNANANKTPTPTPTPKPSPSPSPSVSPTPSEGNTANSNSNTNAASPRPTPSVSPTPRVSPTPTDAPVNGGVLNGRAISLPVPTYPTIAKQVGAQGQVAVQVLVDERGNVISAKAIRGNPLLRSAAEAAARQSRISPARIGEQNVKTTGVILYNFRNN